MSRSFILASLAVALSACGGGEALPPPPVADSEPGGGGGGDGVDGGGDGGGGGGDGGDGGGGAGGDGGDGSGGDSDPGDGLWRPRRILLVIIDTLRRDAQGYMGGACDATPHLDALAEEGVVLEQVHMPRGLTRPSVATILSGLYPRDHGVWNQGHLTPGEVTLWPDYAAAEEVAVFASNACPIYQALLRPDPYLCLDGGVEGQDEGPIFDAQVVGEASAWLDGGADASQLGIVHLLSPHSPYSPDQPHFKRILAACPEVTEWNLDDGLNEAAADGIDALEQAWLQRIYEAGAGVDDAHVGALVSQLTAQGFFEDGLLVVGADHGEELFTHADYLYEGHWEAPWGTVTTTSWIF